jgi:hypothetical protein
MAKATRVLSTPPTNTLGDPKSTDHRLIAENTAKLIEEYLYELDPMDDDCYAIVDYARMLVMMLAHPDAGTALDGVRRLMHTVRMHAENLKTQHDAALGLARNLIATCEPATRS